MGLDDLVIKEASMGMLGEHAMADLVEALMGAIWEDTDADFHVVTRVFHHIVATKTLMRNCKMVLPGETEGKGDEKDESTQKSRPVEKPFASDLPSLSIERDSHSRSQETSKSPAVVSIDHGTGPERSNQPASTSSPILSSPTPLSEISVNIVDNTSIKFKQSPPREQPLKSTYKSSTAVTVQSSSPVTTSPSVYAFAGNPVVANEQAGIVKQKLTGSHAKKRPSKQETSFNGAGTKRQRETADASEDHGGAKKSRFNNTFVSAADNREL